MAERWQQWMPFHIDKFRGSPEVQAMHPAARAGYLYLLASAWQTEDCTIPSDPLDLATASGLGDDLWAQYGPRIIRKFELVGSRYRNAVLFDEWFEAKKVYDKRKLGAVRTNSARSPHAERTQCDTQSEALRDTGTGTGTGTTTEKEQKPSGAPFGARPSKPKLEADSRHTDFRAAFRTYFLHKNPSLKQEPWDAQEAANLARFLRKNPQFTTEQWKTLLTHRARSPVPHGESLSAWIARAFTWLDGPTNAFGKKPQHGGSNGTSAIQESIDLGTDILEDRRRARGVVDGADRGGGSLEAGNAGLEPSGQGNRLELVLRAV